MDDGKVILGFDPADPEGRLVMAEEDKGVIQYETYSPIVIASELDSVSTETFLQGATNWMSEVLRDSLTKIPVTCSAHGVIGYTLMFQMFAGIYEIEVAHLKEMHPRRYYQLMNS